MDVENREVKKVVKTVNSHELAEDLSLWNIVGEERIVGILKNVVLSYFADKEAQRTPELPSIILAGERGLGKRTIGRALANSLGMTDYRECLGRTLAMGGIGLVEFLGEARENTGLFIIGAEHLSTFSQHTFHTLLSKGEASIHHRISHHNVEIEFSSNRPLLILSIEKEKGLFPELLDVVDLHLTLDNYSPQQVFLILKQRCEWCGWITSDKVLKMIAQNSEGNPAKSIKLVQICYFLSRSRDKNTLGIKDAQKSIELLGENSRKE